jgi:YbbR domain-containing protein
LALSPRSLIHNWRLKLTALGLSVFLWALVQTEPRNAETFSPVPVVVEMSDTAWVMSGPSDPATVELRLSGPAREMVRLARSGTSVVVRLAAVGGGDTLVTLRRDWVVLEEGSRLVVESVSPSAVRLGFEPAVNRVVPIAVRTSGELPPDLAFASPVGLNPPIARLRGPKGRVDALDSVRLGTLDLSKVTSSGVVELPVDTAGLGGIRVFPPSATVGLRVEERAVRTVTRVPIIAQSEFDPSEISVEPEQVDVILSGARTLVSAVDPLDLRAWVAAELLDGMAPGQSRRVPVRLEGVPSLVSFEIPLDVVTVRRAADGSPPGA